MNLVTPQPLEYEPTVPRAAPRKSFWLAVACVAGPAACVYWLVADFHAYVGTGPSR